MAVSDRERKGDQAKPVGAVLVVGGGIGGMQASLDLAESGFYVYLVDTSPTIGGVMSQLDKTFPTNDCAMCIMSPKLVGTGSHRNIRVITHAEIKEITGPPGSFEATILRKPRYIRSDKCTGCGECAKHCPATTVDTYNEGMSSRAAIYLRYPQAIPKVFLIDREACIGCGLCERVCLANAIDYGDEQSEEKISVGSVILAPGFEVFDAARRPEFGYGVYPNVLTSIEFERILSATGPHRSHLLRPSDGTIPERIAFIQCVGSRDRKCGNDYCSSVCCMYAIKEAIIAKEHVPFVKPTIFSMDIRAYGKGFDAYYERAKADYGVRFVKSMVSRVEKAAGERQPARHLSERGGEGERRGVRSRRSFRGDDHFASGPGNGGKAGGRAEHLRVLRDRRPLLPSPHRGKGSMSAARFSRRRISPRRSPRRAAPPRPPRG